MYRSMILWCFVELFVLKFDFEKWDIFFYIIQFLRIFLLRGLLHNNYQQASSLMGHQTNHSTSMFLSYKTNLSLEYICIVINGKILSFPLNMLSSVHVCLHI